MSHSQSAEVLEFSSLVFCLVSLSSSTVSAKIASSNLVYRLAYRYVQVYMVYGLSTGLLYFFCPAYASAHMQIDPWRRCYPPPTLITHTPV